MQVIFCQISNTLVKKLIFWILVYYEVLVIKTVYLILIYYKDNETDNLTNNSGKLISTLHSKDVYINKHY